MTKTIAKKAKVITAISMFYDVEDPAKLVEEMSNLLADDGVLIIQQNYLLATLQNNAYDNVCLAKGELVTTIEGNKKIEDIKEGDLVLTHTGKFRKVLKKFVTPNNDKEMIRLRAYGAGYDLNVTKNHPIYVQRDGKWSFIPAEEVKLNDIVGKPVVNDYPQYTGDIKVNENIAKIIGYYLAEGSYCKHKDNGRAVGFSFNAKKDEVFINELISALKSEGYSANINYSPDLSTLVITTYGVIAGWLFDNFKHHALHKTIPMWVFGLSKSLLKTILVSWNNGDGYEYRDGYLRSGTVSSNLAYGLSLIANKVGYKCSLNEQVKPEKGMILGRTVNLHNSWDILVHTKPEKKQKVWMEDGIQCMRVRKIELLPYMEESVYNLEVEEDNSYVTPAMTVHNCHEHIGYHTLMSMEHLFDRFGLECVDVSTSMVNGGVLRTVCQKKGVGTPTKAVQAQRDIETAYGLDTDTPYRRFANNVKNTAHELKELITEINASGKKCYIYGASTRGGTIWQYVGLDVKDLPYAVERNPGKVGKKIASIGVPIISEEQARIDKPDFMLVSIWFFFDAVKMRESEYLKSGGHLIRPLPTLEVI